MPALNHVVSVVIPVYNAYHHIERMLCSLFHQSFTNFEVILVDDGSTDNSASLINQFIKNRENYTLISQTNSGPSVARNKGLELAKGEFILFVDSDDWIDSDYIEKLVKASTDVELVLCGYIDHSIYGENKIFDFTPSETISKQAVIKSACLRTGGTVCSKLYRNTIISRNGLKMDPSLTMCEDLDFLLRYITLSDSFRAIDYAGYHYNRMNENSLSGTITSKSAVAQLEVTSRIEKYLIEQNYSKNDLDDIMSQRISGFILGGLIEETKGGKEKLWDDVLKGDDTIKKYLPICNAKGLYLPTYYILRNLGKSATLIYLKLILILRRIYKKI
ncbi:MAG: glycosyltransferase family 2 protein [Phocaeicola sp.]